MLMTRDCFLGGTVSCWIRSFPTELPLIVDLSIFVWHLDRSPNRNSGPPKPVCKWEINRFASSCHSFPPIHFLPMLFVFLSPSISFVHLKCLCWQAFFVALHVYIFIFIFYDIHPRKLTWQLEMCPCKRKFRTWKPSFLGSMFSFRGCI